MAFSNGGSIQDGKELSRHASRLGHHCSLVLVRHQGEQEGDGEEWGADWGGEEQV